MGDNIPLTGSDGDGSLSFYDVAIDLENCNMSSTLVDTDANQWCISCRNLKQTIEKMKDDYEANYKMLKEKIISTNDLIKRYKLKCDEYDATSKKLVDTERKLDNTIRAKDGMMVHLKQAMDEQLPVKEWNAKLEKKLKAQETWIAGLQDTASMVPTLQTQLNALKKLSEIEKRKHLADCAEVKLQSKKVLVSQKKGEERLTKTQDTMKTLKQQLSDALKKNKKLTTENEKLQNKLPGKQSATNRKGAMKPVATHHSSGKDRLMSPPVCGIEMSDDDSLDAIFAEVGIVGRQRWSGGWTPVSPLPSSPASSLGSKEAESSDEELGNEVARLFESAEETSILPTDTTGDRLSDSDSDSSDDASTEVPFRCDELSVLQPVAVFEASPVKAAVGRVIRPTFVKGGICPSIVKGNNDIYPNFVKGKIQLTLVKGNTDIHPTIAQGRSRKQSFTTEVPGLCSTSRVEDAASLCNSQQCSNGGCEGKMADKDVNEEAVTAVKRNVLLATIVDRLKQTRSISNDMVELSIGTVVQTHSIDTVEHSTDAVEHSHDTVEHPTDTVEHSIVAVEHSTDTVEHSTDTVEHSTDTVEHSTDSVEHLNDAVEHSTDTVEYSTDTVEHSTDTVEHLTDTGEHSTDTVEHSTDTVEHPIDTVAHSTDRVEHSTDTGEHSTDTVEHLTDTVEHSTDTVEHPTDTVEHSTDTVEHPTDAVEHSIDTVEHPTDTVEHLTDTGKHSTDTVEHSTDTVEHPIDTVAHSTDTVEHSTDTVEHPTDTVEHPTDAVEHSIDTVEHSADTVEHAIDTMEHSNDTMERRTDAVEHPTDTVYRPTDTMEHPIDTVEHSTATVKHSTDRVEHSTDTVEHSNDTVEHSTHTVEQHSTDTVEHSTDTVAHSTDTVAHSTDTVEHSTDTVEHPTDNVEHSTPTVEHSTDTVEHSIDTVAHSTDTVEHSHDTVVLSSDAVERSTDTVEHPTDTVKHPNDTMKRVHSVDTVEHSVDAVKQIPSLITAKHLHSADAMKHSPDVGDSSHRVNTTVRSRSVIPKLDIGVIERKRTKLVLRGSSENADDRNSAETKSVQEGSCNSARMNNQPTVNCTAGVSTQRGTKTITDETETAPKPSSITPQVSPSKRKMPPPVMAPKRRSLPTRLTHVKNQALPRVTLMKTPVCVQPVEQASKLPPKLKVAPASVSSEKLSTNESRVSLKRSSEQTEALDLSMKPKTVISIVKDNNDTTTGTYKLRQRVQHSSNARTGANDVNVTPSAILAPVASKKRRLRAPPTLDNVFDWLNPLLSLPKPPVSPLPLSPVQREASSGRQFFPDLNEHVPVKTETETAASKAQSKKRKKAEKKAKKLTKALSCSGDIITNMHAVNNVLLKPGAKQTAAGRKAINIELELLLRGNVKPALTASNISRAQPAIQPDVFIDCVTNILCASKVDMLPVVYTCCRAQPQKLKQPFLAPDEHKLLGLLLQLDEQACFVDILEVFLMKILTILRTNENTLIPGRTALCRLFAAICRIKGDISRVRVLAYDTVRRGFPEIPLMTLAIAGMWPKVLRPEEGKETCVLRCLRYAIYKSLQESKERHHQLSQCLTALCGWPPWASDRQDEATVLAKLAMDKLLQSSDDEHLYDAAKALELLSAKEGWQWTNNHLIIKLIWPVLQRWLAGGQHLFSDSAVGSLLRVLGIVTYSCPPQHASAAHEVIQTLQALLTQSTNVCDTIQEALLEALMLLAPFKPDVSAHACHTWVKERHKKQPLQDGVKAKIREFVEHYKCRFKYLAQLKNML